MVMTAIGLAANYLIRCQFRFRFQRWFQKDPLGFFLFGITKLWNQFEQRKLCWHYSAKLLLFYFTNNLNQDVLQTQFVIFTY